MWRYYEGVPDDMASLRTPEAAVIADRHLWCVSQAIAAPVACFLSVSRCPSAPPGCSSLRSHICRVSVRPH